MVRSHLNSRHTEAKDKGSNDTLSDAVVYWFPLACAWIEKYSKCKVRFHSLAMQSLFFLSGAIENISSSALIARGSTTIKV